MISVYKKELKSYFTNMTGYIAIGLILIMTAIFVKLICLDGAYPNLEYALPTASIILLLAVPIITMRSFAEERQQETDQLLFSLPLTTVQIVMGKYLAMMTVFAVPVAILALYPLVLAMYGSVNFLATYASLLLFLIMTAAMVGIGMFMSSLTESQTIAAVLGSAVLIVCYFASVLVGALPTTAVASYLAFTVLGLVLALAIYYFVKNYWVAFSVAVVLEAANLIAYLVDKTAYAGLFQEAMGAIAIFDIFNVAVNSQLFDLTAVVYYLSIAAFFTFLTVQTVEKRRYN
jgi:ABC-2 type transport system permease protein